MHRLGSTGGHLVQSFYFLMEARELVDQDVIAAEKQAPYRLRMEAAEIHAEDALAGMHKLLVGESVLQALEEE